MSFETFNVEDRDNETIVSKYNAYTLSLFINTIVGDTEYMEPVHEVWFFIGNDQAFIDVVKGKIEARLKGTS